MWAWQARGYLWAGKEHLRQRQEQQERLTVKFLAWKMAKVLSSTPVIHSYTYIPTYIFLYVLVFSSCCPCSNFKPLLKCESKVRRESKSSSTSRMTATIDSKTNDCHCQVCASTFEPVPGHQFCVKVRPHFSDFPLSTSISTPLENRCQAVSPRSPFKLNC